MTGLWDDLNLMEVCMQRRMNIMLVAILVMLGAIIWIVVRGQKTTIVSEAAPSRASGTSAAAVPTSLVAPAAAGHTQTASPAPASCEPAPTAALALSARRDGLDSGL